MKKRPFLARLFLIISFPFWFPRLIFWFLVEFWNYQIVEWLPPTGFKKSSRKTSPPSLAVIEGGKRMGPGPYSAPPVPTRKRLLLKVVDGGLQAEADPTNELPTDEQSAIQS